jgi:hypothetical protein
MKCPFTCGEKGQANRIVLQISRTFLHKAFHHIVASLLRFSSSPSDVLCGWRSEYTESLLAAHVSGLSCGKGSQFPATWAPALLPVPFPISREGSTIREACTLPSRLCTNRSLNFICQRSSTGNLSTYSRANLEILYKLINYCQSVGFL